MDFGQLLLGLAAFVGAISAAWNGYKALRNTNVTTKAAHALQERVQDLNEHEAIITRLEKENSRLEKLIESERTDRTTDRQRARDRLAEVLRELDEQRDACQRAISATVDALNTLQGVVGDEVARAAAVAAISKAQAHLDHHGGTPPDGVPTT